MIFCHMTSLKIYFRPMEMHIPMKMKQEQGEASFEASKWKKHCMYKVPWCLRGRGNDNDFRPQLVSIGPYHSADPRLKDMQFHKNRMLDCILKRTGKDISEFYDAIKDLEHEARLVTKTCQRRVSPVKIS